MKLTSKESPPFSFSQAPTSCSQRSEPQKSHEIWRLFQRMKTSIYSSLVGDLPRHQITARSLFVELLIGSQIATNEFDQELAAICLSVQEGDSLPSATVEAMTSRAAVLSRACNRVCTFQRSLEQLLESTSPLLERHCSLVRYEYEPFAMEGQGVEAFCRPYGYAINVAIDAVADATRRAILARDFHGAALLSILGSNLDDFAYDLNGALKELSSR